MELTGIIIAIMEAKSGKSKQTGDLWMKQEYVLEVPGVYSKRCMFSLFGEDKIKQFNVQMGENLTVQFEIDAREYNGKWYNNVKAFHIIKKSVLQSDNALNGEFPFPPFDAQDKDNVDIPF